MSEVDIDALFRREPVKKPTWRKALPWAVGVGAVAGGIAALIIFVGNTGHSTATPLSDKPAKDVSQVPKTIKLDPAARRVARDFILTAVARKNLRHAYTLVGPGIKQGQTMKEWMTGNIAVVPYPVDQLDYAPMKIDFSYPNEAMIEIALLPRDGAKIRPQLFMAYLKKINGKWVVDAWTPRSSPPVPNGSANNGAGQ
jgi:hypothetical protein